MHVCSVSKGENSWTILSWSEIEMILLVITSLKGQFGILEFSCDFCQICSRIEVRMLRQQRSGSAMVMKLQRQSGNVFCAGCVCTAELSFGHPDVVRVHRCAEAGSHACSQCRCVPATWCSLRPCWTDQIIFWWRWGTWGLREELSVVVFSGSWSHLAECKTKRFPADNSSVPLKSVPWFVEEFWHAC